MTTIEALDELIAYAPEYSSSVEDRQQYTVDVNDRNKSNWFYIFIHTHLDDSPEMLGGIDLSKLVIQAKSFIDRARLTPPPLKL